MPRRHPLYDSAELEQQIQRGNLKTTTPDDGKTVSHEFEFTKRDLEEIAEMERICGWDKEEKQFERAGSLAEAEERKKHDR